MIVWLTLLLLFSQVPDTDPDTPTIVATVGDITITKNAVNFLIAQRVKGIFAQGANSPATFDAALQHLIDQAIALNYLESRTKVEALDLSVEIAKIERQLARSDQTLDSWLDQQNRHRQDLEFEIRWRKRWSVYAKNLLNDSQQRVKAFKRWGRQFDGSQVEVSQILLKTDSQNRSIQLKLANEIHARLMKTPDEATWNAEVLSHSQSPNRNDQERPGYVGQIEYRYPMPERFARVAFSLEPLQISEPFQTGLGIHIVRVLDRRTGDRTIDQCRNELDRTMKREAFQAILDRHRKKVSVSVP